MRIRDGFKYKTGWKALESRQLKVDKIVNNIDNPLTLKQGSNKMARSYKVVPVENSIHKPSKGSPCKFALSAFNGENETDLVGFFFSESSANAVKETRQTHLEMTVKALDKAFKNDENQEANEGK